MITEKDLIEAIRQCEAEPHTQSKMAKLADFYIIYDHLFGAPPEAYENTRAGRAENTLQTHGGSEFLRAVNGKKQEKVLSVLDELMDVTKVLHPRMYDTVMRRISDE